jgi:hypothetical protein
MQEDEGTLEHLSTTHLVLGFVKGGKRRASEHMLLVWCHYDLWHVPCGDAPNSDGGHAIVEEVEVC